MTEQPSNPPEQPKLEYIFEHMPYAPNPDMGPQELAQTSHYLALTGASAGIQVDKKLDEVEQPLKNINLDIIAHDARRKGQNTIEVSLVNMRETAENPLQGWVTAKQAEDGMQISRIDFGSGNTSRLAKIHHDTHTFNGHVSRYGFERLGRWEFNDGLVAHGALLGVADESDTTTRFVGRVERTDRSTFDGIANPDTFAPITGTEHFPDKQVRHWRDGQEVQETTDEGLISYLDKQLESVPLKPGQTDVLIDLQTLFDKKSINPDRHELSGAWKPGARRLLQKIGRHGVRLGLLTGSEADRDAALRIFHQQFGIDAPFSVQPGAAKNQTGDGEVFNINQYRSSAPDRRVVVIDTHTSKGLPDDVGHITIPAELQNQPVPKDRIYTTSYEPRQAA